MMMSKVNKKEKSKLEKFDFIIIVTTANVID